MHQPSLSMALGSASESDLASGLTGHIFQHLASLGTDHVAVDRAVNLGLSEHWLIPPGNLRLYPWKILGHGTFGVAVAGTFHGTSAVVKVIGRREPVDSVQSEVALCNEIRILRQLRHPNIVLFFGACIDVPCVHY